MGWRSFFEFMFFRVECLFDVLRDGIEVVVLLMNEGMERFEMEIVRRHNVL